MIRRREVVCFGGVYLGALLTKLILLLTSQSAPDADEAIVGLMAMHVRNGVSHPLFFYGQTYDAGSGLLAHAAALVFYINKVSALDLKLTGFLVWFLVATVIGATVWKWLGPRAAGIAVALFLWSPTSVEWALKGRGGYMVALLFTVTTIGLALRGSKTFWQGAAVGGCGAAAIWAQPSVAPVVAVVFLWLAIESIYQKKIVSVAGLVIAASVLSLLPLSIASRASNSWSWQTAGGGFDGNPLVLSRVLLHVFTPEMDWSFPPPPFWVAITAGFWLLAAVAACCLGAVAIWQSRIPDSLRRPAALLLTVACVAPAGLLMVDAAYVRPRHLFVVYPLACMAIAGAFELYERNSGKNLWLRTGFAALLLSGAAVHFAYMGPPVIHGAAEQESVLPAVTVDRMIADLDRHGVGCVFSESPMLQWNLMFNSQERIAVRWLTPQDRWQPYVDRVNRAFEAGEPCAVLLGNLPYHESIMRLGDHFGEHSPQFTAFGPDYALLYNPPRQFVRDHFK